MSRRFGADARESAASTPAQRRVDVAMPSLGNRPRVF